MFEVLFTRLKSNGECEQVTLSFNTPYHARIYIEHLCSEWGWLATQEFDAVGNA